MSIQAIAQVLELEDDRLDATTAMVLIGIANHVSPDNQCFPGVARLMRYSKSSERTVRSAIKKLEEMGLLLVERRSGTTSLYHLNIPVQGVQGGGANPAGGGVQEPHPNRNSNRKDNASDARADLADDWLPSAKLRAKLDRDYPRIDIDAQAKAFVLANRAKGQAIRDPDAAFEVWMLRTSSLKMPVKERPLPTSASGPASRGPEAVAASNEREAMAAAARGNNDEASRLMLEAARIYVRLMGMKDDARRCADAARKAARKGSWAEEQVDKFIAAEWPATGGEDNG